MGLLPKGNDRNARKSSWFTGWQHWGLSAFVVMLTLALFWQPYAHIHSTLLPLKLDSISNRKFTGLDYVTLFEQESYNWFSETFQKKLPKRRKEIGNAGSGGVTCAELTSWDAEACAHFQLLTDGLLDLNKKHFIPALRGLLDPEVSGKELLALTLGAATIPMGGFEEFANGKQLLQDSDFSITGGSGVGFHIECGEKLLVSYGGGGGGTLFRVGGQDGWVSTSGGGGGIQAFDGSLQVLVGGGTGVDSRHSAVPSADSVADRTSLFDHWPRIKNEIEKCPLDQLHFFGGGAGVLTVQRERDEDNFLYRYFTFAFEYGENFGRSLRVPEYVPDRGIPSSYCEYFLEDFQAECWKQNMQHPGEKVQIPRKF